METGATINQAGARKIVTSLFLLLFTIVDCSGCCDYDSVVKYWTLFVSCCGYLEKQTSPKNIIGTELISIQSNQQIEDLTLFYVPANECIS